MQSYHSNLQYTQYQRIHQLANSLAELMGCYGYELLETPVIESADLFLTKAGDQIIKKLFTFERHGQELALRPEFTAPAAHYYVTRPDLHQPVVRWQFNGPVFEDNPDDFRHDHQRFSMGAELIGARGPLADAEIMGMAMHGLRTLEIPDSLLLIGHAGLTRQVLARFGLDTRSERFLLSHLVVLKETGKSHVEELLGATLSEPSQTQTVSEQHVPNIEWYTHQIVNALLDSSPRGTAMGGRTREDITRRLLRKRKQVAERAQIEAALEWLDRWVHIDLHSEEAFTAIETLVGSDPSARQTLAEWRIVIDLLTAYDVKSDRIRIQPALARSWEYYTGIVFELRTRDDVQLGGGGRYDELARLLGSQHDVPAVGFAYYVDEMLTTLNHQELDQLPGIYVQSSNTNATVAIQWAQKLRSHSLAVILTSESPAADEPTIHIEEDGSARFGNKMYPMLQLDALLSDLNEIKHER